LTSSIDELGRMRGGKEGLRKEVRGIEERKRLKGFPSLRLRKGVKRRFF